MERIIKQTSLLFLFLFLTSCGFHTIKEPTLLSSENYSNSFIADSSIKILTWNVHKEEDKNWQRDMKFLNDTTSADIFVLQEASSNTNNLRLYKSLKMGWELSANLSRKHDTIFFGAKTASLSQPVSRVALLSSSLEPFIKSAKPLLITKYLLEPSKTNLMVINIHAINFKVGTSEFQKELIRIFDIIKTHKGAVIFAGDFNTWSKKRFNILNLLATEKSLIQVDFGNSLKHIENIFGNAVDHIFYTNKYLEVIENSSIIFDRIKSSDHKPLFVEFRLVR